MKHLIRAATVATALVATAGLGYASTLDQNNATGNGDANGSDEWQQQVTAGVTGLLAGINLYAIDSDTETLSIGIGDAPTTSFVFTETVSLNGNADGEPDDPEATFIDLSSADILLTAGETFVIDLSDGSVGCCGLSISSDTYAGGDLYLNGSSTPNRGSLPFQTYMDPTPTPEPSSILLLLTGLFGGALLLRRRVTA